MSIFCSEFGFGDEHKPRCKRMRRMGKECYEYDDSKPCTCGDSPLKYQGSHVLPSDRDERGGLLGFASIPPHITRNGKDNGTKPHPWLRFHLSGAHYDSVILTRKQVGQLHDALGDWLDRQNTPAQPEPRK